MLKKMKGTNVFFVIAVVILVSLGIFLVVQINNKKLDEKWKTDKITISLADGTTFDVVNKETVGRISRLCNDGTYRMASDKNKVDGSCAIWLDFNNGTILGMFQSRDYGYVGDTKQYIGESCFLPNGLNQFIRNIINENVNFNIVQGEIIESKNLGYLLSLDEYSKDIIDSEKVFVSYENLPFTEIKDLNFKNGDNIKAFYNGEVIESFPPQIYCSRLELVNIIEEVEKEQEEIIIREEEINEGYESKLQLTPTNDFIEMGETVYESDDSKNEGLFEEMEKELNEDTDESHFIDFQLISLSDLSITEEIPNWVKNEVNLNNLYSITNSDYLVDVLVKDRYQSLLRSTWTSEQKQNIILGQGIKCFNLDDDTAYIYYPLLLNNNVVSLIEMKQTGDDYEASIILDFVNALNDIVRRTSEDTPLILIRKDNVLGGMVEDTVYAEKEMDISEDFSISEISGEIVVNIFEELEINEITE